MASLTVEMLQAERGDSILIEYGADDTPTNRILIDGGPVNGGHYRLLRERIQAVPTRDDGRRFIDLLIISHVDADHIEGIVYLLQDEELRCLFGDIWFNGWKHLADIDEQTRLDRLGGKHGEFLGALLERQGRPWNQLVGGGPVFIPGVDGIDSDGIDDDLEDLDTIGPLPVVDIAGGMKLTVVSPTVSKLQKLAAEWQAEVKAANFEPGDSDAAYEALKEMWWSRLTLGSDKIAASPDRSAANGASIAVLAEFHGRSILLAADAHDDVLTASLRRLRAERGVDGPLHIDALKLSHHGSKQNTTDQLLDEVRADHYLISTSGDRFHHPNALAIRRIVDRHAQDGHDLALLFNYEQANTVAWRNSVADCRFGDDAVLSLSKVE